MLFAGDFIKNESKTGIQMPIDVTMKEPNSGVVCNKSPNHIRPCLHSGCITIGRTHRVQNRSIRIIHSRSHCKNREIMAVDVKGMFSCIKVVDVELNNISPILDLVN